PPARFGIEEISADLETRMRIDARGAASGVAARRGDERALDAHVGTCEAFARAHVRESGKRRGREESVAVHEVTRERPREEPAIGEEVVHGDVRPALE